MNGNLVEQFLWRGRICSAFALLLLMLCDSSLRADSTGAAPSDEGAARRVARDIAKAYKRIAKDARASDSDRDSGTNPEPAKPASDSDSSVDDGTNPAEGHESGKTPRALPRANKAGGQGKTVLWVEIHEVIDMGLAAFVKRLLANPKSYSAVVFDINTPGGRVDAATLIRDAIMGLPKSVPSVAFIHPRAISAGAFISFSCDYILIAEGGTIGAATPITIEGGKASPVGEKMVSYFRSEMASTARAKGRNGKIAAAMVDADVAIKGVTVKGKLLTLDTAGAIYHKIADARADTDNEVLDRLALPLAQRKKAEMNWAEKLARILTDPMLTGILMSIGMLGVLIELYHPGFGLPGIVGITCLVIFFAGHMVVHLAGLEEVVLFVVGGVLLFLEAFVIPGFGVAGVLGIVCMVSALMLALTGLPVGVSFETGVLSAMLFRVMISVGISIALLVVAIFTLPKRKFVKNRLVLEAAVSATAQGGTAGAVVERWARPGDAGVADSDLRPAGIGRFSEHRVDVVTEGGYVAAGTPIKVIRVEGNQVVVEATSSPVYKKDTPAKTAGE